MPAKEQMKIFRDAVVDPVLGKELNDAVKKVLKKGGYAIGGKKYKKIPKGYDQSSKYSEFLLYEGLYAYYESKDFDELVKNDLLDYTFKKFKDMLPVHKWLVKVLG
jgi:hypothetical protein